MRALLEEDGSAALVVRFVPAERDNAHEAMLIMRVARLRVPPAPIVVLTSDPDATRARLFANGVTAEILRAPASLSDLVVRLGGT